MITLAVTNLKGGTGKTTSAAHLAHVLHEQGRRVLMVDADPQRSALTWSELAEWPFATIGMPTARIHRELPGIVQGRYDAVVIDTPPSDDRAAVVASALRVATHVVIPCAPTPAEFERLRVLWSLIEDNADLAEVPPAVAVLLVRAVTGAVSTGVYREVMTADGWRVLRAVVARRERYAQSFGEPIVRAVQTSYGDAVAELIEERVTA
ncbi:MAG: chromosome partitioning protein [Pseudonocardiales bacterium]|nr:chromosome partitioning protein [Pseudonocardiales bacterium]